MYSKLLSTDELLRAMSEAEIAGCTCRTKTPVLEYHSRRCHYRLFVEAGRVIRSLVAGYEHNETEEREHGTD